MKGFALSMILFFALNGFGQMLMDWNYSSCSERSYPEFIRQRLVSIDKSGDTLHLRVGLILNCCISPELKLRKSNDSLFVDVENISDEICGCECCFEIEMKIAGITEDSMKIFTFKYDSDAFDKNINFGLIAVRLSEDPNKYIFPSPDELKVFENYDGEMNQTSDNGEKIGLWRRSGEKHNYLSHHAMDANGKYRTEWYVVYDLDGSLVDVCGWDGIENMACAEARDYYRLFGVKIE